jgi:hypothetical protein
MPVSTESDPSPVESSGAGSKVPSGKGPVVLVWVVLACLLLGSSALVRLIQERRQHEESNVELVCPFPLENLPRTLGRWKSSSEDQKLDSKTLQITGGKEYTIRTYTDESTGVRLMVLCLFGPLEPVIPHIPAICYPANGFEDVDKPLNRTIKYSYEDASGKKVEAPPAVFKWAIYKKKQSRLIEGVYHSFRYEGAWSPDVGLENRTRRNSGVFKLQIQRLVAEGESRDGDKYPEPIEDFLKELIPAIEHQISLGTAKSGSKSVASK